MTNRVAPLIHYFAAQHPGVGRTMIVKFLYLADLEARKLLGRPITDLQYIWNDHGPFDFRIYDELERLKEQGFLSESAYTSSYGGPAYRYESTGKTLPCEMAPAERAIVAHVAADVAGTPLRQLLDDVVYETKPMVDAKARGARGQLLRMELVNNEARTPGLELDRMYEAIDQLDRGEGRPLKDVLARLG